MSGDLFADYSTTLYIKGLPKLETDASSSNSLVWNIDRSYHMTGVEYLVKNCNYGDTARLELFLKTDMNTPIITFGDDVYLRERHEYSFYTAEINNLMAIKVTYTNTGLVNPATFYCNLILHVDRV